MQIVGLDPVAGAAFGRPFALQAGRDLGPEPGAAALRLERHDVAHAHERALGAEAQEQPVAIADRLARRVSDAGTVDVGSAVMERRTRSSARGRGFRFRVVPGDNAATRLGALDEVFHDDPVDGVLHVVAWGHATPRRTAGVSGSAQATREAQLAAELEDWAVTSHLVASMAVRREKPIWLVIVVTKADLFEGDLDEALRYYSPGSGSPFGQKLDELRALAGGARLSIDVLPMCSPEAPTGGTGADEEQGRCDARLSALETRLEQLSGHV